jgi:hypothetical protein
MEQLSHECKENNIPGVTIRYVQDKFDDCSGWTLENKFLANVHDVNAGEAEKIGEELSCSMLVIRYCPFCGKLLSL